MKVRKNRQHQVGASNLDVRTGDKTHEPNYRSHPSVTSVSFLSQPKPYKFSEIVKARMEKTQHNPMATTKAFYQSHNKQVKEATLLGYPRTAQLEEKDKQKRVFTGDSNLLFSEKLYNNQYNAKKPESLYQNQKAPNRLLRTKQSINAGANQETQLVGMDSKGTLEGKVDLDQVRDIRRALRRRYANRRNLSKIFKSWDEEGKGYLTIKNVHDMVNKLGLKLNLNEAQVLIASSDKNFNGMQSMDEFMDMVFNTSDALDVDLHALRDINNEQECNQLMQKLNQASSHSARQRHHNQLFHILKQSVNGLQQQMLTKDIKGDGKITEQQFKDNLRNLRYQESVMDQQDMDQIVERFAINEGSHRMVDYKAFIKEVRSREVDIDALYNQTPGISNRVNQDAMIQKMQTYDLKTEEQAQLGLQRADQQPVNLLELILQKKNKISSNIRKTIDQDQLQNYLQDTLQATGEQTVSFDRLKSAFKSLMTDKGIMPDNRDFDRFLSGFTYNKQGETKINDVPFIIYQETEKQFYDRNSMKSHGPKPKGIIKSHSEATVQDSPIRMAPILQKIENKIFCGKSDSYEVFKQFDQDKDGFVSRQDITNQLHKMDLLTPPELSLFLNYVDPHQQQYLTFQEFSKKVKSNMGHTDDLGNQTTIHYCAPHKEYTQSKLSLIANLNQSYQSFAVPFQAKYNTTLEPKTRFGANPPHKNTFEVFQGDKQSALYLNESQRFQQTAKNSFQRDDKQMSSMVQNGRVERLRNINQRMASKIEQDIIDREQRQINKNNTKYLATWTYEHRVHMQNDWK